MKLYTQLSPNLLYDRETHKLVMFDLDIVDAVVEVPWYYWKDDNNSVNCDHNVTLVLEHTVNLNRLSVNFINGFMAADIKLEDKGVTLFMQCRKITYRYMSGNQPRSAVRGISYDFKTPESAKTYYTKVPNPGGNQFVQIPYLASEFYGMQSYTQDQTFCYGVVGAQYSIIYQNKELEGKTYALICGPWAILLKDDMSFDALVTMKVLHPYWMEVDKVLYSANPYLSRLVFLMG